MKQQAGQVKNDKKEFVFPSGSTSAWIIVAFLLLCFLQVCYPHFISEDMSPYTLLFGTVDFCLLVLLMMIVPALVGILKTNITPKGIKLLCAINSIVVFGVSFALLTCKVIPSTFISWLSALLFYFINTHSLLQLKKQAVGKRKALTIAGIVFAVWIAVMAVCVAVFNGLFAEVVLVGH